MTFTEADLKQARKEVSDLEAEEHEKRQAGDQMVASMRAEGKEPLSDPELFSSVDAKYREADAAADKLPDARTKLARVAREVGVSTGDDGASAGYEPPAGGRDGADGRQMVESWGQTVVTSDQYKQLIESGALRSDRANISMSPVEVASRDDMMAAGLFRAQTIGDHGPLVPSDRRLAPPVMEPQREIMVLDLINIGQTDSDQVEYAEETARTSGAGGAAFGTAFGEFTITWATRTVNVRRRGAEHTATRGNLADQGQLRTILDTLLDEDVRLEAEDQIVAGDGTGENFTGVYETAGISNIAFASGETDLDQLHRGITAIRLARRRDPSALLIDPEDHEGLVLAKDANDRYQFGSPTESDRRTIWGFPAVPSEVAQSGVPMWGRWNDATLWLREGLTVSAFNQHEDYAARGLVLLVAEHRAAFRVIRATGFCSVELESQA